jgi:hypothetical protein
MIPHAIKRRTTMLRLKDLIGKTVIVTLRDSEKDGGYDAVLHGVETGGLWLEIEEFENLHTPKQLPNSRPPEKPVTFVPYAQILFLIASSTVLDEKSLGV